MNLYELTSDFLQLQALIEDPDVDPEAIHDTMEAIECEFEVKAENYAKVIRNLEGNLTAIKAEVERLNNKKNLIESGIQRLKANLHQAMVATNKRKFKTDLFSFSIQRNGGADPVIVDVPIDKLPDDLVIITEAPNRKAIAEYIKKHPETELAHFGVRGESLRIK